MADTVTDNKKDVSLSAVPDPTTLAATENNLQQWKLPVDEINRIGVQPVLLVDPKTGKVYSSANPLTAQVTSLTSGYTATVYPLGTVLPQLSNVYGLVVIAETRILNGSSDETLRTPTIWKQKPSNQLQTDDIWIPAAGKKFRLMGIVITVSKDAACAGQFNIAINDALSGGILNFGVSQGALVATGQVESFIVNLPENGYLSAIANNHLVFVESNVLTAGGISISAWGTEE